MILLNMKNYAVADSEDDDKKFINGSPLMRKSYEANPERFASISEAAVSSAQSPSCSVSSSHVTPTSKTSKEGQMKINERNNSNFAYRICDHVKMVANFSETVKGKLSLGARIIQQGGRENIFKKMFGLIEGEELLKASQCYISTTSGPIAGILFISTEKVAFCSERSITVSSSNGQFIRKPYKVMIPVKKIKSVHQSENSNKPDEKYIEILTVDDFEFWFMGFLRYEKAFTNLQKAISNV